MVTSGHPQRAGSSPRQVNRVMLLYTAFQFLSNIGIGVFALLFNIYLRNLGLREDFIGLVSALSTLSWAAGALIVGPISRRVGARAILFTGIIAYAVIAFLQIIVVAPILLIGIGFLLGFTNAAMTVPSTPYVFTLIPPARRTQAQSFIFAAQALSTGVASLLGGVLPSWLGGDSLANFRLTMFVGILLTVVSILPLFLLRDAPEQPDAPNRAARLAYTPTEARQCRKDNIAFACVGGLMALGTGALLPFYNVYLTTLGASPGMVGALFAISSLAGGVISLGAPYIARRLPPLQAVAVMRLLGAPFALVIGLGFASMPLGCSFYAARMIGVSLSWPIESSTIGNVLDPRNRISLFGARSAAWNAGMALASWVGGTVIVRFGYGPVHLNYVVMYSIAMLVFLAYWPRRVRAAEAQMAAAKRTQPGALQPA
jgi:MFS family permease